MYLFPETTVDCCKFFLKRSIYPLANYLYSQAEAYINTNGTCLFKVSQACKEFIYGELDGNRKKNF